MKISCDTSILLNLKFNAYDYKKVTVPITCIEELDNLKTDEIRGYLARRAINIIKDSNNIEKKLFTYCSNSNIFLEHKNDNRILSFALEVYKNDNETIFITDDYSLYLKAEYLKLPCKLFEYDYSEIEAYTGIKEINIDSEKELDEDIYTNIYNLYPNQYLIATNSKDKKYLYMWNGEFLESVKASSISNSYIKKKDSHNKILPLDIYQRAFMHMLQNDNVKVKITDSIAGCGKSYLMIHWALQMLEKKKYKKMFFIKSDSSPKNRKDFPAIPGGIDQKFSPFLGVIGDTVEENNILETLISDGKLEIIPINFVKGRSLKNIIFYINETQDFTPSEMKKLLSRLGEGSVALLDGSTKQIDNKYCLYRNGLTAASENFKDKHNSAQVNMVEDYRSELCKMVGQMDWHD